MLLAILVIFLLYKFSIPSAQSSTTFVQNEGELGTTAYYIVFGLFLLVLLFIIYNKYKYRGNLWHILLKFDVWILV
jgi:membrane protein YdbS with pleckstrin-like domain